MAVPIRILARRARAGDPKAALEAAGREEAEAPLLEELSHRDFPEIRIAVARNPATDDDTLLRLAYDPDIQVAAALARRTHLAPEILNSLALRAAADYYVRRGRERAFVLEIVVALASNQEVPLAMLKDLLQKISTSHLPRLLAREATRADVLTLLHQHPKPTVRQELIGNPSLPEALLLELRADHNEKVAAAAEQEWRLNHQESIARLERDYRELKRGQGDKRARHYDRDSILLAGSEEAWQELVNFFISPLPGEAGQGLSIFELGCASGKLTAALAGRNPAGRTTGIDISPGMLEVAGKQTAGMPGVDFLEHDLAAGLPRENTSLDLISAWEVFHCVPNPEALLHACKRGLRDGGLFLGIFACLADDSRDNETFARVAEEHGFFFPTFETVSMQLATSGLVISELSPAFEKLPRATDITVLQSLKNPLWYEIIKEAEAAGCNPAGVSRGIVRVVAKKMRI